MYICVKIVYSGHLFSVPFALYYPNTGTQIYWCIDTTCFNRFYLSVPVWSPVRVACTLLVMLSMIESGARLAASLELSATSNGNNNRNAF